MLSEHRDMAAAQAFFRSAKAATGLVPDRVTTDGHGSYPRAIRATLDRRVAHRTSRYKNNGPEQDHRGVKGRIRCMRGFKSFASAERFCRSYDELRNFLRPPHPSQPACPCRPPSLAPPPSCDHRARYPRSRVGGTRLPARVVRFGARADRTGVSTKVTSAVAGRRRSDTPVTTTAVMTRAPRSS